ncbi:MAG TPA: hypothetical protein VHP14_02335 [Anaerolineales bacterium]|nr:hypothetical protein [Anaerolineales bacterium]
MKEDFDFDGKQSRGAQAPMQMWDMLSILVLILTVCLAGYFVLVFVNPESPLNPLKPGAGPLANPTTTPTATPLKMQPTWTASPTLVLTPSETLRPTFTPLATDTPFSLVPPTKTPKPTNTPKITFAFSVAIKQIASTIYLPDSGCSYFGVAGEAVDLNNAPYLKGIVKVGGVLGGQTIDPDKHTTVTGVAMQFGPAGFEIPLEVAPVNSKDTVWIQLFDTAGVPLSEKKFFSTSDSCEKNLIQVRFRATKPIQ